MTEKESTSPTTPTSGGFFKSSFFSNVSSSVSSISQSITTKGLPEINKRFNEFQQKGIPEINKRLNDLQQKARDLPTQLAHLQGDLESERASFIQQNGQKSKNVKGTVHVAPWEGYQGYEKEMKRAIMDISNDERNFLISPPEETSFQFDLNAYSPSAQAALKQDEKLSQMRFLLVPQQVKEPIFWRNYFYRVTLAKQTVLSQPIKEDEKDESVLFDFKDEEEDVVVVKEKEDESEASEEDVVVVKKKDVLLEEKKSQLQEEKKEDTTNYEGMEEWEIELRKAAII